MFFICSSFGIFVFRGRLLESTDWLVLWLLSFYWFFFFNFLRLLFNYLDFLDRLCFFDFNLRLCFFLLDYNLLMNNLLLDNLLLVLLNFRFLLDDLLFRFLNFRLFLDDDIFFSRLTIILSKLNCLCLHCLYYDFFGFLLFSNLLMFRDLFVFDFNDFLRLNIFFCMFLLCYGLLLLNCLYYSLFFLLINMILSLFLAHCFYIGGLFVFFSKVYFYIFLCFIADNLT